MMLFLSDSSDPQGDMIKGLFSRDLSCGPRGSGYGDARLLTRALAPLAMECF
jgi:hypothetical protein